MKVYCSLFFLALFGPFAAIARDKWEADKTGAGSAILQAEVSQDGTPAKLWEDDFSGNWRDRWPLKWSDTDNRLEYFERDGETWIRVIYPEGGVGKGFKAATNLGSHESVYLEYKVRFAEDFDFVLGGKLPGLAGGSLTSGQKPTGEDGWLGRIMWREGGEGVAYVYHPDMPGKWGENISLGNFWFQKGVIHTIGLEVVMNTPGQNDGSIRAWLDGVLVVERTDMRFRDIPELAIDSLAFSTFFGGNTAAWAPDKDETAEFGDLKIYEAPPWQGFDQSAADPL